jgi:hypothetical protein
MRLLFKKKTEPHNFSLRRNLLWVLNPYSPERSFFKRKNCPVNQLRQGSESKTVWWKSMVAKKYKALQELGAQ